MSLWQRIKALLTLTAAISLGRLAAVMASQHQKATRLQRRSADMAATDSGRAVERAGVLGARADIHTANTETAAAL